MLRRIALILLLLAGPVPAAAQSLTIAGVTDTATFRPVIEAFRKLHPQITVEYHEYESIPLDEGLRQGTLTPPPDLVISSAVDRQFKAVNDGLARPYRSEQTRALPDWARFADEAFGFTFEPLVFVANRRLFPDGRPPSSRAALLDYLEAAPTRRIATYDPLTSGVGYLVANMDLATNSQFAAFIGRSAQNGLSTFASSLEILQEVAAGRSAIAFNVLGSYAAGWKAAGADIEIVYPVDYTFALMRVALIPRGAREPRSAELFLDFLLSEQGQTVLTRDGNLPAIRSIPGPYASERTIRESAAGPIRIIGLDATLLAMADDLHRRSFETFWRSLVETGTRGRAAARASPGP
ncbi:ABC transporter substrate-binding protein [Labrys wisconsinensis]|uniref:ABC-type Fe3+ transport system substrate-binding protein n=1 Tax=Labrys wisconsinensis TaxID=425677 RepID=A0ABU0J4B1_9HYPH|nr:ABC transporter substrate-binding protein [Labrys wisconsinensis]MDQ0468376.1 ABC-type Fe3+ transport system substrate-binding protein [Labrys wisconsinensis]